MIRDSFSSIRLAILAFLIPMTTIGAVEITDNVMDEGMSSFKVQTNNTTYYFQKEAGGFSSIVDKQGNDWVSWNSENVGHSGTNRGLPNLFWETYHPGKTGHTSTIASKSSSKVSIATNSPGGSWKATWDFYPTHATFTLTRKANKYWFLYEGTPGGTTSKTTDYIVRAPGTKTTLAKTPKVFTLPIPEWVYFGDPAMKRVFFLIHIDGDSKTDTYWTQGGTMTVFGFGRSDNPLGMHMTTAPNRFSIGFFEETNPAAVKLHIEKILAAKGGPISGGTTEPAIKLTKPNGGESYKVGDTVSIQWSADTTKVKSVVVDFSANNGIKWHQLTTSVAAKPGLYRWAIPNQVTDVGGGKVNPVSSSCKIRIRNPSGSREADTSDAAFTIKANPSILWASGSSMHLGGVRLLTANGRLRIAAPTGESYRLLMVDSRGRTVLSTRLPLNGVFEAAGPAAKGVYIVRLIGEGKTVIRKLFIL